MTILITQDTDSTETYKCKKGLKIPKGLSETVNCRKTDNKKSKRKRTKGQTIIYKTPHRILAIEQHELHLKQGELWSSGKSKDPAPHVTPVVLLLDNMNII